MRQKVHINCHSEAHWCTSGRLASLAYDRQRNEMRCSDMSSTSNLESTGFLHCSPDSTSLPLFLSAFASVFPLICQWENNRMPVCHDVFKHVFMPASQQLKIHLNTKSGADMGPGIQIFNWYKRQLKEYWNIRVKSRRDVFFFWRDSFQSAGGGKKWLMSRLNMSKQSGGAA